MWPTICAPLVLQGAGVSDLPGQRLSWERPLDLSLPPSLPRSLPRSLLAAIAHLKAELSGISLCQGPYSSALFPHSALQLRLPLFSLRACTHAQARARSRCNGDICKRWHFNACMLAHGSTSAHDPANTLAGKLGFFFWSVSFPLQLYSTPRQTNLASQRFPNPTFVNVLFKTISGARSDKLAVCIGESTRLNISWGLPRLQTTSGGRRLMVGWATSTSSGPRTFDLESSKCLLKLKI